MTEFKPTYLYIKEHKITGLRYFGKTTGTEQFLLERYSNSMKGKNKSPRSEEFKRKVSATMKGRPLSTITCPHCAKIGGVSQMKRWHFNNCKKGVSRGL